MAQVPNVDVDFDGDGTTAIFDFDFPYQKQSEIFVTVDGVNVTYTWLAGNTHSVQVLPAPAIGTKVRVYRSTMAYVPLHEFSAGVPFLPRYVDENNRQLLYATQEAINSTAGDAARALLVAAEARVVAERAEAKVDAAVIDSAFQLRLDLAAYGPTSGAGLVGYDPTAAYAPGSIGHALRMRGSVAPTIEALRAAVTEDAPTVFVLGYYTALDGGGGTYVQDPTDLTSADNGGTVIVDNSGRRWVLHSTHAPSTLQFGIRATSEEDQTERLNAAITAMVGRQLDMPNGEYRVDGSVVVYGGTRLRMEKAATLRRMRSKTFSTVPVLYVIDSYSECNGGFVKTDNNAPEGIVILGHRSVSDDRNAWYWRFTDMDVEGNGYGWGWVIPSGQVLYPMNANYFGTIANVTMKNVDFGCLLFENANAHNISNLHFWLCRSTCIWVRGGYANHFSNVFFHGGAADGCIGIYLVNKTVGPYTESEQNTFVGFTCETGGLNDKAFVIGSLCTGNVLIGTSNVAGGYTIGNFDNHIQLSGYGAASVSVLPGQDALTSNIVPAVATPITPAGFMGINTSGGYVAEVLVYNTGNGNLSRVDTLLIAARNETYGPSALTRVSSAFTSLGVAGEPTAAAYTLDFTGGAASPRLAVSITASTGSFSAKVKLRRI